MAGTAARLSGETGTTSVSDAGRKLMMSVGRDDFMTLSRVSDGAGVSDWAA